MGECWGNGSGGCWEQVLTWWGKNRCSNNLGSRGSEVLCGGERGRGWADRCVSGCIGVPGGRVVSCLVSGGCFGLVFLTLEKSQQAAVKSSERRHTIALWTLNVSPWQVIVKSEPFPDSRRLLSVSFRQGSLKYKNHFIPSKRLCKCRIRHAYIRQGRVLDGR